MSLFLILLAASCASLSNLLFRKNIDRTPEAGPHLYLLNFYLGALLMAFLLYPSLWSAPINWKMIAMGSCVGALNVALMGATAKALSTGPSGMTFAFQNAAAIFPGALLYLLFGSDFGFSCSYLQVIGIILVIYGLFYGAKKTGGGSSPFLSKWLLYVLVCSLFQVLALTLMQGRCIFFQHDQLGSFLSTWAMEEKDDVWFMPAQFGTACLLQALFFARQIKKHGRRTHVYFGLSAGFLNGTCTFLILLATKIALPSFKVILFPAFATLVIILCNTWANRLYAERFNLRTNVLCATGILLGIFA